MTTSLKLTSSSVAAWGLELTRGDAANHLVSTPSEYRLRPGDLYQYATCGEWPESARPAGRGSLCSCRMDVVEGPAPVIRPACDG